MQFCHWRSYQKNRAGPHPCLNCTVSTCRIRGPAGCTHPAAPRFLNFINHHHLGELGETSTVSSMSYLPFSTTLSSPPSLLTLSPFHGSPFQSQVTFPKHKVFRLMGLSPCSPWPWDHCPCCSLYLESFFFPTLLTLPYPSSLGLLSFPQRSLPAWIKAPARGLEVRSPSPCSTCYSCDFTLLV